MKFSILNFSSHTFQNVIVTYKETENGAAIVDAPFRLVSPEDPPLDAPAGIIGAKYWHSLYEVESVILDNEASTKTQPGTFNDGFQYAQWKLADHLGQIILMDFGDPIKAEG